MPKRHSEEIEDRIIVLKLEGLTHREISMQVFGDAYKASTVCDVLSRTLYKDRDRYLRKIYKDCNILIFDLESAPAISYHFGRWKINVGPSQVISRPYLLTWAAKWLDSPYVMSDMLPNYEKQYEIDPSNDKEICKSLWNLLDQADIVVAHYGDGFDIPLIQTRFLLNDMKPPSPFKSIDTKKVAKKYLKFEANSLDEISQALGCDNSKIKTDFSLWRGCMEGNMESWNDMLRYNEMDVVVLEDVYKGLRPWDKSHPNINLFNTDKIEEMKCGICGGKLEKLESKAYTTVSVFDAYQCTDCGHHHRGRKNILDKSSMSNILSNVR